MDGGRNSEKTPAAAVSTPQMNKAPIPAAPLKTMMIDGKPYVLIDGRWYPKTNDNIYLVNGEKVYFVDGRTEPVVHRERAAAAIMQDTGGADELLGGVKDNPLSAYSPEKVKQMMETLENAKVRVKERDAALKALTTAD